MLKVNIRIFVIITMGFMSSFYPVNRADLVDVLKKAFEMDVDEAIKKIRDITNKKDGIDPNFNMGEENIPLPFRLEVFDKNNGKSIFIEKKGNFDETPSGVVVCLATYDSKFLELFKPLKDHYSFDLYIKNPDGDSALDIAVQFGALNLVTDLLKIISIHYKNIPNQTLKKCSIFGIYSYNSFIEKVEGIPPVNHFIEIMKMLLKEKKKYYDEGLIKGSFAEMIKALLWDFQDINFGFRVISEYSGVARYIAAMGQLLFNVMIAAGGIRSRDIEITENHFDSEKWKEFDPEKWAGKTEKDLASLDQKFPYNKIPWKALVTL